MTSGLVSVEAKIARAQEHLDVLVVEATRFLESDPHSVVAERNTDATKHVAKLIYRARPDFIRWGLMVGDCIHNLRCALDHLIYAIAVVESREDPPPDEKRLQFPITSTPDEFAKVRWRISVLPDAVQAAVERLQPYNRPHADFLPALLMLNELDNSDKHRLLHIATMEVFSGEYELSCFTQNGRARVRKHIGKIEHGTPLLTVWTDQSEPEMHVKLDVSAYVAISHTAGPNGETQSGIDWVLEYVRDDVLYIVSALRAFVE